MHPTCPKTACAALAALLLLVVGPSAVRAADVLENVPHDALGFVVIRNIGTTNDQAERVLQKMQFQFPGPLALLKLGTGISDGLDSHGDLLLAVLPGAEPSAHPRLSIWLPVTDYKQLVTALNGTPTDGIDAVTVAGEDLLIAQHGPWALIMDPDQRDQMHQLLVASPAPPGQTAAWKNWIDSNNVSAFLLPNGWHALWAWAATDHADEIAAVPLSADGPAEQIAEDLEGPLTEDSEHDLEGAGGEVGDFWSALRQQIRNQLREFPQLARWAAEADAIGCGVRVDDDGNLVAGVRIASQHNWPIALPPAAAAGADAPPPTLFQSGQFILNGTARLPGSLAVVAAGTYARIIAAGLRDEIHVAMDEEAAGRFQSAVERATAQVTAASVLTRPGDKDDGTYSNAFLAVRVVNADAFGDRMAEVMAAWNAMNKSDDDESRLVFEKESARIGGHASTIYSLDMVEAFGAAAIPEMRPSMERLFGPGGKLRLMVVPIDEHIVLLAVATEEQVKPLLDVLALAQPTTWDKTTNRLLPQDAAWRLMISPEGQSRWLKRQMDAMLGPVIGAPLVRQFPSSPPIGAAGGFTAREIWADVAVPTETLRAAGQYLHQR